MADLSTSQNGYLDAKDTGSGDTSAYMAGGDNWHGYLLAWLAGGQLTTSDTPCYIDGGTDDTSDQSAYTEGVSIALSLQYAYAMGIERSSVPVCLVGGGTMEYDHIWLKTDDAGVTLSKKFRVVAEGYDDGSLDKSQSIEKTIGGGIDASTGEIYKSWAAIIKVRETEIEANYGDLEDLETFYSYNNPGGTPSDRITLVDHHGNNYVVLILGAFQKMYLGVKIEGEHAWLLVKMMMQEVK